MVIYDENILSPTNDTAWSSNGELGINYAYIYPDIYLITYDTYID